MQLNMRVKKTREELEPMKKTLAGIDRALTAQRAAEPPPDKNVDTTFGPDKNVDTTFGIYRRGDGKVVMGNKLVQVDENKKCRWCSV